MGGYLLAPFGAPNGTGISQRRVLPLTRCTRPNVVEGFEPGLIGGEDSDEFSLRESGELADAVGQTFQIGVSDLQIVHISSQTG